MLNHPVGFSEFNAHKVEVQEKIPYTTIKAQNNSLPKQMTIALAETTKLIIETPDGETREILVEVKDPLDAFEQATGMSRKEIKPVSSVFANIQKGQVFKINHIDGIDYSILCRIAYNKLQLISMKDWNRIENKDIDHDITIKELCDGLKEPEVIKSVHCLGRLKLGG